MICQITRIFYFIFFPTILNSKLIALFDIFRHGPRAPLSINDTTQKDILNIGWNKKRGELTDTGLQQQFLSGLYIQQKYIKERKLFSLKYNRSEIKMFSTDVNRTLLSGYSKLEGIFHNKNPKNLPLFPPISMVYYPSIHDIDYCKGLTGYNVETFNPKIKLKLLYYKNHFEDSIWNKLKYNLNLHDAENTLVDYILMIKIAEGIDVATIEGKDFSHLNLSEKNLSFIREFKYYYSLYGRGNDEEIKIMSIPFIYKLTSTIDNFITYNQTEKYIGFSVHDASLVTLFRVLMFVYPGIKEKKIEFSSQFHIELYDNKTISILFNGDYLMNINYETFKSDVFSFIGTEDKFKSFCEMGNVNHFYFKVFVFSLIIFAIILTAFLYVYNYYNIKKSNQMPDNERLLKNNNE